MGQSCGANDDKICRKRTPNLPIHESIIQWSAQEQRVVENCQYTSVPMGIRLELFFAQLFLLISSVFTEEFQICVNNVKLAMLEQVRFVVAGQSDPLFVSSVMKTHILSTDDLVQEDLFRNYQERMERLSQQNRVIKIFTDA